MKTKEAKTTKVKIPRAKDVGELFHHYANQVKDSDRVGGYSYDGLILKHNDTKLARILDLKKKIVVIMDFNMGGSYCNGKSYYHVSKAFSDEWTILKYSSISNLYNETLTQDDYFKICMYHIKQELIHFVDVYGKEKELIENNRAFLEVYSYDRYKDNIETIINMYVKKFKLSRKEILNYNYNEVHYTAVRYKGWGKAITNRNDINKPVKFYLNKPKWFTEKELAIIEFKKWKAKYINKGAWLNGKTYLDIYTNLELRQEFERRVDVAVKTAEATRKREAAIRQEKQLELCKIQLGAWLDGSTIPTNLYSIPIHMRIIDGVIQTTQNARVPIEDGMKLFKLFHKIRNQVPPTRYTSKEDITVGMYKFRNIEFDNEHWYCNVGCHKIRDTEIDLFIERNNLQEWLK